MNDECVLRAITAMRLLSTGRHHDAAAWLQSELTGLQAFVSLQAGLEIDPPEGPLGDAIRGWGNYYKANYPVAFEDFSNAESTIIPWLKAYAWLGKAKVCTDLGFFADAAQWCCNASCLARQFELDEWVAAAQGALGEILLRTGYPRLATEAFSLDMALLPASDRFRGRVMCYQAHAYRRLGAYSAANLAYRTSSQQPGEQTAPYAYAGLAMLGAETDDAELVDEAIRFATSLHNNSRMHTSIAWIYIAKSRLAERRSEYAGHWLVHAKNFLPAEYVFEHCWLACWTALVNMQVTPVTFADSSHTRYRPTSVPEVSLPGSGFDTDLTELSLENDGFASIQWAQDKDGLWAQYKLFVV